MYRNTEGEFVSRLRPIFERFRLHNLFRKASKCKFGYSELDFVGKVISEEGLQMSRKRIQSVYAKQLKSFLGTVNYFRDFIRNQSSLVLVHLLDALIADYHKTRKIQWTTEALKAYEDIKLQVSKCTIMYFMSDTAPITLHTDAIGAGAVQTSKRYYEVVIRL